MCVCVYDMLYEELFNTCQRVQIITQRSEEKRRKHEAEEQQQQRKKEELQEGKQNARFSV